MELMQDDKSVPSEQRNDAKQLEMIATQLLETDLEAASSRAMGIDEQHLERFTKPIEQAVQPTSTNTTTCSACGGAGAVKTTDPDKPWAKDVCDRCGGSGVVPVTA